VQARCGSSSQAPPRAGDDSDASRKISVFHPDNYFTVPELSAPATEAPRIMMRNKAFDFPTMAKNARRNSAESNFIIQGVNFFT
jgi:hypothetical protein